jgi:hypothetical protein
MTMSRASTMLALILLGHSSGLLCMPALKHEKPKLTSHYQESSTKNRQTFGASQDTIGTLIWQGENKGVRFRWTSSDFYMQLPNGWQAIFGPLVEKGFDDFVRVTTGGNQASVRESDLRCVYERDFRVLSVVGTLVSFEDRYYDYCGGAHPTSDTRFTTVDVGKTGDLVYVAGTDTPMMDVDPERLGRIVSLSDYFADEELLRALLSDSVIRTAIARLGIARMPQRTSEIPKLFAEREYELGDSGFELRPDYLTRFVFHHIENGHVAVRVGLPPHYGFNRTQHKQLGLILPIPSLLQRSLVSAAARRQGFLMNDARKVAGGRFTRFVLRTPKRHRTGWRKDGS